MTITDLQKNIIETLQNAGYENVKDSLLAGITYGEKYPVVIVDIVSSSNALVASGEYIPLAHCISVFVYQKLGFNVKDTRETVSEEIQNILDILDLQIIDNRIEYIDTVLNNIKVCSAGCKIESDTDITITYRPTLAISSNPIGAKISINGIFSENVTPLFINKAISGTYAVELDGYEFDEIEVDMHSDYSNKVIHFENKNKENEVSQYSEYLIKLPLSRANIIKFEDYRITEEGEDFPIPEDTKYPMNMLNLDDTNFAIKFPIPYSYTIGKSNLKVYKNGIQIDPSYITETHKFDNDDNDVLSNDYVFIFIVELHYDENALYEVEITEKKLYIEVPNGVPFFGSKEDPIIKSGSSNDILLPKLSSPYVYEIWRFKRYQRYGMRQYKNRIADHHNEGSSRFILYCRGDIGEHTLSEISSRRGILWVDSRPRNRPFKFAIYDTISGARSELGCSYGYNQIDKNREIRGIRRIYTK